MRCSRCRYSAQSLPKGRLHCLNGMAEVVKGNGCRLYRRARLSVLIRRKLGK